jgi:type I restriction enzyme R subunit
MSENLTQLVAETASLGWFKQLGCAVHLGTQLASGGSAAERELFSDVVLGARLHEAIRQINPVSSKAPQAADAQPATVQSICWMNL